MRSHIGPRRTSANVLQPFGGVHGGVILARTRIGVARTRARSRVPDDGHPRLARSSRR
jgi:hypothetical protein